MPPANIRQLFQSLGLVAKKKQGTEGRTGTLSFLPNIGQESALLTFVSWTSNTMPGIKQQNSSLAKLFKEKKKIEALI